MSYGIKETVWGVVPDLDSITLGPIMDRFAVTSLRELRTLLHSTILVRYKGLVCFGETSFSPLTEMGSADETYGVIACLSRFEEKTVRVPYPDAFYENVDSGDSRNWPILPLPINDGYPRTVGIYVVLGEEQDDYIESYSRSIKETFRQLISVRAQFLIKEGARQGIRVPEDLGPLWDHHFPRLTADPSHDKFLGHAYFVVEVERLVRIPEEPLKSYKAIEYHLESPLITNGDASYKVYFDVIRTSS